MKIKKTIIMFVLGFIVGLFTFGFMVTLSGRFLFGAIGYIVIAAIVYKKMKGGKVE